MGYGQYSRDGKIMAIYTFVQEGETDKEGLIIELKKGSAFVKVAELKLVRGKGTLEVVDNDNEPEESLPEVACSSVKY
jgi:hypothetical protein